MTTLFVVPSIYVLVAAQAAGESEPENGVADLAEGHGLIRDQR